VAIPLALAVVGGASASWAQRVGADRALTVVMGSPDGVAATERLDVARTNVSAQPLPAKSLRILWTRHVPPMSHAPVVLRDGTVVVVSDEGETLLLNTDGTDRGRLALGPGPTSAPAVLADGTLLVVNATGDAVGARHGALSFRTHIAEGEPAPEAVEHGSVHHMLGGPRGVRRSFRPAVNQTPSSSTRAWLLPLEDGGAVAAIGRELVSLDRDGAVRSRAVSPVPVASPLLSTAHGVAFVSESGEAYVWDLRTAADAVSGRGSFGGAFDGAVAAADDQHLVAVIDATRLVSLDLGTGETSTRTHGSLGPGIFTGAFALERSSGTTLLEQVTLLGTRVLAVDADGRETPFATSLALQGIQVSPDAGAAFLAPSHTALLADRSGRVAYATVDGHVGVASATSKVEMGTLPCGAPPSPASDPSRQHSRVSAGFAGLVPAGPGAFVVACESGRVSFVQGDREQD